MDPVLLGIVVLVFFGTILYRYMKSTYEIFEVINIPGPKPIWVFGNLAQFKDKNPLDVFKEMRKTYGDIFGFFEGFRPSIVINDPEMSRQILLKHFDKFHERPIYNPFVYYPDEYSLLNSSGYQWKHQRTVIATAFKSISREKVIETITEVTDKFLQLLTKESEANPEGFDISWLLDRLALDSFALSAFNYDVNSLMNSDAILYKFMLSFNKAASADNPLAGLARVYPTIVPFLKLFDGPHMRIHNEHLLEMRKLVSEHRQDLKKNNNIDPSDNLLTKILLGTFYCRDDMGKMCKRKLSDEETIGHLHSLVGGGIGTTNAALEFVTHMLAVHPEEQQKMYEEIVENCGASGDPDLNSLEKLKYMEMFMNESLRLLPCAPGVARTCTEDTEINGTHFKKGMVIRIMTCTLYTDEKYFPEPDKFIPERFSEENSLNRHQCTFLPFGFGPRVCVGYTFAIRLIKIILVKLLQKYALTTCSKTVDPLPTALRPMLSPKDGVYVNIVPRKPSLQMKSHG